LATAKDAICIPSSIPTMYMRIRKTIDAIVGGIPYTKGKCYMREETMCPEEDHVESGFWRLILLN
jgi:hypothetical protein